MFTIKELIYFHSNSIFIIKFILILKFMQALLFFKIINIIN